VSEEDNYLLLRPVQDHEVKNAIFQMDKHKIPGPDGFSAAFFHDGKLLKQINHTLIALISKVDHPISTAQFRPISLCNTLYKIIAKILVNRMRPILEKIIDPV